MAHEKETHGLRVPCTWPRRHGADTYLYLSKPRSFLFFFHVGEIRIMALVRPRRWYYGTYKAQVVECHGPESMGDLWVLRPLCLIQPRWGVRSGGGGIQKMVLGGLDTKPCPPFWSCGGPPNELRAIWRCTRSPGPSRRPVGRH